MTISAIGSWGAGGGGLGCSVRDFMSDFDPSRQARKALAVRQEAREGTAELRPARKPTGSSLRKPPVAEPEQRAEAAAGDAEEPFEEIMRKLSQSRATLERRGSTAGSVTANVGTDAGAAAALKWSRPQSRRKGDNTAFRDLTNEPESPKGGGRGASKSRRTPHFDRQLCLQTRPFKPTKSAPGELFSRISPLHHTYLSSKDQERATMPERSLGATGFCGIGAPGELPAPPMRKGLSRPGSRREARPQELSLHRRPSRGGAERPHSRSGPMSPDAESDLMQLLLPEEEEEIMLADDLANDVLGAGDSGDHSELRVLHQRKKRLAAELVRTNRQIQEAKAGQSGEAPSLSQLGLRPVGLFLGWESEASGAAALRAHTPGS